MATCKTPVPHISASVRSPRARTSGSDAGPAIRSADRASPRCVSIRSLTRTKVIPVDIGAPSPWDKNAVAIKSSRSSAIRSARGRASHPGAREARALTGTACHRRPIAPSMLLPTKRSAAPSRRCRAACGSISVVRTKLPEKVRSRRETAFRLAECAEISLNAKYSPLRQYGSCVGGSRNHMRTYQKLTVPSTMSTSPRVSPPIPCQGARQGKDFPCHCPENHRQAIDSPEFSAVNRKNFPDIPCRQGNSTRSHPRHLTGLPPLASRGAGGPDGLVIAERDGGAGPAGRSLGEAHGGPEMAQTADGRVALD